MSDTNDKKTSSSPTLAGKLSLRREQIKVLRVRSEVKTGMLNNGCTNDSQLYSCTGATCGPTCGRSAIRVG